MSLLSQDDIVREKVYYLFKNFKLQPRKKNVEQIFEKFLWKHPLEDLIGMQQIIFLVLPMPHNKGHKTVKSEKWGMMKHIKKINSLSALQLIAFLNIKTLLFCFGLCWVRKKERKELAVGSIGGKKKRKWYSKGVKPEQRKKNSQNHKSLPLSSTLSPEFSMKRGEYSQMM